MGEQIVMLFFMFIGWVQGMNPQPEAAVAWPAHGPQAAFRRVLA